MWGERKFGGNFPRSRPRQRAPELVRALAPDQVPAKFVWTEARAGTLANKKHNKTKTWIGIFISKPSNTCLFGFVHARTK